MTKHQLTPMIDRILARVQFVPSTGCWEFTGAKTNGYGVIGRGRRDQGTVQVHRAIWEIVCGPVQSPMQLDHLCRNRACCNLNHLELVTQQINILRGTGFSARNAWKTHCPQGHPYSPVNTYWYRGSRHCRACKREKDRRYQHKRRVSA